MRPRRKFASPLLQLATLYLVFLLRVGVCGNGLAARLVDSPYRLVRDLLLLAIAAMAPPGLTKAPVSQVPLGRAGQPFRRPHQDQHKLGRKCEGTHIFEGPA